jgi:phage terminase Nu1 subunit (DNA packaging protein)
MTADPLARYPLRRRPWTVGDPVGVPEIAGMLDVKPRTVEAWARKGRLPAGDYWANGTVLWERNTIIEWADEHQRDIPNPTYGAGGLDAPERRGSLTKLRTETTLPV